MTSLDGIADLHMSGTRAVFRMGSGSELVEADFAAAFERNGMKLEAFEKVQRPRAGALYLVDSGVT